jgi:hypothetical protein
MATKGDEDAGREPPPEREPYIPRPPSPEEVKQISEEQALITDEWGGEGPEGAGPAELPVP